METTSSVMRESNGRVPLSGVVADCVKRWFRDTLKEAKAGDINMQVLVGQMYYNGYGVHRDAHKLGFPPDLLKKSERECLVLHNHKYSISPKKLQSNAKLSSFFEILTTSKDKDDKVFVSTARGLRYPVTLIQWNLEKNAFEWAASAKYPHTEDAIRVTQSTTNFFISQSRKSSNRPDAQEVRNNLIYNYNPTYGGKAGKGYDQVYIFE